MATASEYAQWIVNNPDKKGTPEFQTVSNAYQAAKIKEGQSGKKRGFIEQQFNELADVGVGAAGEIAKFAGRILPGITGEQLQAKTEKLLTPTPKMSQLITGNVLNPEAVETGRLMADVGLGFVMPVARGTSLLARTGTGAASGAATAGLINPEDALTGAVVGGVAGNIPNIMQYATQRIPESLMQSAIKPTAADLRTGKAKQAIQTMLEEGVNPTMQRTIFGRGLDTLKEKVGSLNNQIADIIQNSKGNVSKASVLSYLDDLERKAMQQVNPANDLNAIQKVRDEFISHPLAQGQTIPVQLAQKLKSGTYKAVGAKSYGELGSTATEAQKQLARGLKEEIAIAEPSVSALNAQESSLINALNVSERRALQQLNNNPMSLSLLASDPRAALAFMADKSGPFKALLARILYRTGQVATPKGGLLNVPASTVGMTNE